MLMLWYNLKYKYLNMLNIQLAEQQLAIKLLTDYFPQLIIIHLMKHINM